MMLPSQLLAFTLTLAPSLVAAGMFPKDSLVKMLDHKTFKKAMQANETSMVAFVAPWCGHCQKMVPEYSKAALGMHPLVPAYAVNCHAEKNKRFCSEQGVQGFPTVKLFPRGNSLPPILYDAERTSSNFFYFATQRIPKAVTKMYTIDEVSGFVSGNKDKPRALLMSKDKKIPLLWQVLGNKYLGTDLVFGSHRDRKGKSSIAMGYEPGGRKESKVLFYPAGSETPILYQGLQKLDSLTKFFDSVLDGSADLTEANEKAKAEEFVEDPEEAEIFKKQESQRIALLHGGFTDLIDFEKAMLEGGANYHDTAGYGGMMGGIPDHFKKESTDAPAVSMDSTAVPITTAPITQAPEATERPKDEL